MSHTDCFCHAVVTVEEYTDLDGVHWVYRVLRNQQLERTKDGINWVPLTGKDFGDMTANHLEFVGLLVL